MIQGKLCRNYQPAIHRITLFGSLLFLAAGAMASSQESSLEKMIPGLKEQAVILDIVARVIEQNQEEVWNSAVNSKVTIPGRPVSIKLIGENIVITAQFTPYLDLRNKGHNVLVAQGQIWVNIPDEGIRYQTTMQTIPLEYGEQIYFFPLGKVNARNEAWIEIQLELRPYSEDAAAEGEPPVPEAGGLETPP
jgi:hypothetical protein